jgi:hypothetical protein
MEDQQSLLRRMQQYSVSNNRWVSDFDFFKIEVVFLQNLLDEYFNNIIRYSHIENLKYICTQLIKINNDIHQLSGLLSEQIIQLELTEIEVTSDAEELTVGQAHLNFLVNNFISTYRGVKTELFVLVEDVIRENQCLIN